MKMSNKIRKSFICSLCHKGILGGGLYLDNETITYVCNKISVNKKYRNIVLPLKQINELSWKWIIFPVATIKMDNQEQYKFIIFNKRRFMKWFNIYYKK